MMVAEHVTLAEFAEIDPAVALKGLLSDSLVSFIPMADVAEGGGWIHQQSRRLADVRNGYTPFADGDVLFAKITPCMENGKGAHVSGLVNGVGIESTEFFVLRVRDHNQARFLYHWLQAQATRTRAIAFMGGSAGQQRVQSDFFSHFRIPKLEPGDQRRIAAVLDAVDATIEKTAAVIAKLKQVRAGLLHDLLTRGLDGQGEVRDPAAHSEEFKDSPIGRIPKEWHVLTLGETCETSSGGTPSRNRSDYWNGNIPWVKTGEIDYGVILDTEEKITRLGLLSSAARLLPIGTVVMALFGQGPTRGRVAMLGVEATVNQACLAMQPRSSIEGRFLFHLLADRYDAIRRLSLLGVQQNLNAAIMRSMAIPLPPLVEQRATVRYIDNFDEDLVEETKVFAKLTKLKSGLAADLLSGHVRVPESIPMEPPP